MKGDTYYSSPAEFHHTVGSCLGAGGQCLNIVVRWGEDNGERIGGSFADGGDLHGHSHGYIEHGLVSCDNDPFE